MQKGSLVDPERTRFDFSHPQPLSDQEIRTVEALVNQAIRANYPVEARLMPYDEALKAGAMALFGETYGDDVRVIGMGDFSTELCGGTPVNRSGDMKSKGGSTKPRARSRRPRWTSPPSSSKCSIM